MAEEFEEADEQRDGPDVIVITLETPEDRDARLKREDWERRDAEAWAERERIMGAPQSRDPEAAKRLRCCF